MVIAPITGTVSIKLECIGECTLTFITSPLTSYGDEASSDFELEVGEVYFGYLIFTKFPGLGQLSLSWEYSGQAKQIIPASAFLHPSSVSLNTNFTVN